VAVECEGRAFHDASTLESDDRRRGDLASLGWLVVPVTWRQLTSEPRAVVTRLHRALRHTS
jgi:very-short-patch-repair endonuclease